MNRDRHLVIVDAGPAGLATARAYREGVGLGRVTMLTPESHTLLTGDLPSQRNI